MRAARFASQLGFDVAPEVRAAMTERAGTLAIVSAERVRDEFTKLLLSTRPRRRPARCSCDTGLADVFLPELPALRLELDEHHRHKDVYEHSLIVLEQAIDLEGRPTERPSRCPGPTSCCASPRCSTTSASPRPRRFEDGGGVSFHHHELVGRQAGGKRLKAMRFDKDTIKQVARLVELHLRFHGYGDGQWTDSAVRRYVTDAGPLLTRLHRLTRSDCTTRNARKAHAWPGAYDDLERAHRPARRSRRSWPAVRPELNGNEIAEALGIRPGPVLGEAYDFLLSVRLDDGPIGKDAAREARGLVGRARGHGLTSAGVRAGRCDGQFSPSRGPVRPSYARQHFVPGATTSSNGTTTDLTRHRVND